jgi:predicted alpha/beta superfamily hydrolase
MTLHKRETEIGGRRCALFESAQPLYRIIQPVDEHDMAVIDSEVEHIGKKTPVSFSLCAFIVDRWNDDLSPWPAPPVFGKEPFGDGAPRTLSYIREQLIPALEAGAPRPILLGGYSLAGLFALWAGTQTDAFAGICGASPSVWFDGWTAFARQHLPQTQAVYLSLGDREEKARNERMATVGRCIREYNDMLEGHVSHTLEWNPGNHFVNSDLRTARGFAWLLNRKP